MEEKNIEKEIVTKMTNKINIGIALIILSPLLGSFLFRIYEGFIGSMISTINEADMLWVTCILAAVIAGIAMVLAGCSENRQHT